MSEDRPGAEEAAMSADLAGKRALVTGGSGGIGLMIARGLAAAGAEVVICSRKADACEAAAPSGSTPRRPSTRCSRSTCPPSSA